MKKVILKGKLKGKGTNHELRKELANMNQFTTKVITNECEDNTLSIPSFVNNAKRKYEEDIKRQEELNSKLNNIFNTSLIASVLNFVRF